jgi:hypothetical protein
VVLEVTVDGGALPGSGDGSAVLCLKGRKEGSKGRKERKDDTEVKKDKEVKE